MSQTATPHDATEEAETKVEKAPEKARGKRKQINCLAWFVFSWFNWHLSTRLRLKRRRRVRKKPKKQRWFIRLVFSCKWQELEIQRSVCNAKVLWGLSVFSVCYGMFLSFGAANFMFSCSLPDSRRSSEEAKKKRKNKKGKKWPISDYATQISAGALKVWIWICWIFAQGIRHSVTKRQILDGFGWFWMIGMVLLLCMEEIGIDRR